MGTLIEEIFARKTGRPVTAGEILLLDVDYICLLYTSDAADERSSVDLGGRRIIQQTTSHG